MTKKALNMNKKILLSVVTVLLTFIIVAGTLSVTASNYDKIFYDEVPRGNAIFPYDPDYMENIFADEEYLKLDRLVCYTEVQTGVTLSIDDNNYSSYNDLVVFMYEYIRSIIYGDEIFYNNCYSDRYIAVEGKQYPFTMQKLYDIEFGIESRDQSTKDGVISKVWLDYKIFKNNVTLRTDIGSDVNRRQYLTIIREGEQYKIISVSMRAAEPLKKLNTTRTVLAVIAIIVICVGSIVASVLIFKLVILKKATVSEYQNISIALNKNDDEDEDTADHEIADDDEKTNE